MRPGTSGETTPVELAGRAAGRRQEDNQLADNRGEDIRSAETGAEGMRS